MIDIAKVEAYAEELKSKIPEITSTLIVIDDTQLSKCLADFSIGDCFLVGFIPSHQLDGTNADNAMSSDHMLWLVLNKIDRNEGTDHFMIKMKLAQKITKDVIKQMLEDKPGFGGSCGIMKFLQIPTIKADPVWSLNGCDGYEINYSLKTGLY
ncbi:hypothetical protein ACI6PS_02595 [Flavobacterium sp. PLA-1-15]|uniref:hypothetical protein n=1 Tax=Flavobacterium sp. PLA-1-15 TaxID=3380533 RepID=UPI003B80672C